MNIGNMYMNNTKIANEIRKYNDFEKDAVNRTNVGGKKTQIIVRYVLSENLSVFDCMVADAVYTLSVQDDFDQTFTLGQILGLLSGVPDKLPTLTKVRKEELEGSVERLCRTRLDIECSAELEARKLVREDNGWIRGCFLPAVKAGRCRYRLDGIMPLYEYAQVNQQVISFPAEWLALPTGNGGNTLSNTKEVMLIKYYLLRQIELVRNPKNVYREGKDGYKVSYGHTGRERTGMLAEAGIDFFDCHSNEAKRHKRQRVHRIVCRLLEDYVLRGYIRSFSEVKGARGYALGVRIFVEGSGEG